MCLYSCIVKKGGALYKKLVKQGIINPEEIEELPSIEEEQEPLIQEEKIIEEDIDEEKKEDEKESKEIEEKQEEKEEENEKEQKNALSADELAKISEKVVMEHRDELCKIKDDESLYDEIKRLIEQELG